MVVGTYAGRWGDLQALGPHPRPKQVHCGILSTKASTVLVGVVDSVLTLVGSMVGPLCVVAKRFPADMYATVCGCSSCDLEHEPVTSYWQGT